VSAILEDLPLATPLTHGTAFPSPAKRGDLGMPLEGCTGDQKNYPHLMLATGGRSQKSTPHVREPLKRLERFKNAIKTARWFATSPHGSPFSRRLNSCRVSFATNFPLTQS